MALTNVHLSSLPERIAWAVSRAVGVPVVAREDPATMSVTFSFGRGLMAYAVNVSQQEIANMDSTGVPWLANRLAEQFRSEESSRLAGALGDIASGFAAGSGISGLVPYAVAVAQRGGDDGGVVAESRARRSAGRRVPPTPPDVTHAPAFGRRKIRLEGKD